MTGTQERRTPSKSGLETRERIIQAALTTVRREGLVGASARAIARTGDFNQALLFYHFGSIEDLLLESLRWANDRRMEQFAAQFDAARNLVDLVDLAYELYVSPVHDYQSALVAIVAGWPAGSEVGQRVMELLAPWDQMVQRTLRRCLDGSSFVKIMPAHDLTFGLVSLLLGVELNRRFDRGDEQTKSLFDALRSAATML
ncbi:MAG: TetR/AcrR family transcriptional regulator [Acidimicrobiia bacterium]|nr:TetR/AcrR family transcriptional regulator [Acidimicrobiia bacterium]